MRPSFSGCVHNSLIQNPILIYPSLETTNSFFIPADDEAENSQRSISPATRAIKQSPVNVPRILVVDDSEINSRFVTTLLAYHGINARDVVDGALAVAECERERYDLILMDIHMPTMDGIEATSRIRTLLGDSSPPIVALTADASTENRERLMDNGFEHVLFKPAGESQLLETISQWTGFQSFHDPNRSPAPAPSASDNTIIDMERGIEIAGGNSDLWSSNLMLTVGELSRQRVIFQNITHEEDIQTVRQAAHKIAGTASYVGAVELERAMRSIEQLCASGDLEPIRTECRSLIQVVDRFVDQAQRLNVESIDRDDRRPM